ncbi:MAG: hypothetical protein EOP61_05665 [Sphingomonadales bacterium]|nr:MAG: hypothetical protein EOP61_05665 [Sphingomonadales bacterium]
MTTRDLNSGATINVSDPIQVFPDLGAGETRPLSCTINPDSTISGRATPEQLRATCRVRTTYRLLGSTLVDRASVADEVAAFDQSKPDGPGYCKAQCEAGNGNCLDLGSRHAQVAAPFVALMKAAATTNRTSIPIEEIYASMDVSQPGTCKRGPITISGDTIRNEGESRCGIAGSSIAALSSNISQRDKLALLRGPFDVNVDLDKSIEMTRSPAMVASQPGFIGAFGDADRALYLSFAKSPLAFEFGPEVNRLNELYGGYVRDVSYGRRSDGGKILIMSTPRGCVKVNAEW